MALASCGVGQSQSPGAKAVGRLSRRSTAPVLEHTKMLASDEFEGRAPGTHGEDLTVAYITEQFKKAGLKPGNPDGTYVQKVPMVGIITDQKAVAVVPQGRDASGSSRGATTSSRGPSAWPTR